MDDNSEPDQHDFIQPYLRSPVFTLLMAFSADVVHPKDADGGRLCCAATCSIAKHELNSVTGEICLNRFNGTASDSS